MSNVDEAIECGGSIVENADWTLGAVVALVCGGLVDGASIEGSIVTQR